MTDSGSLAVTTASPQTSIWLGLGQEAFRRNIAALKSVNEVPGDRVKHSRIISATSTANDTQYILPFETERTLADTFALLASFKEEARTVSAATLQEDLDGRAVTIRLAANQRLLPTVKSLFDTIIACLHDCAARSLSRERCQQSVLENIVKIHRRRIHGKLRSKLWKPSRSIEKEKPSLHKQIHTFLSERNESLPTEFKIEASKLKTLYESADACVAGTESERQMLEDIVLKSHKFCLDMARVLKATSKDKIFDDSRLLPIKKLAHFVEMSRCMTEASRRYRGIFEHIRLHQLPAYKAVGLPTWPRSPPLNCYVHAEIQMITFYAQNPQLSQKLPRVVGASKSACYLCSLFVHKDGQFFISRTHGKLYDQWTVPDIFSTKELKDQRRRYRRVLGLINNDLRSAQQKAPKLAHQRPIRLRLPNESDATLPRDIPRSLLPSEAGTLHSHQSSVNSVGVQTPHQSVLLVSDAVKVAPPSRSTTPSMKPRSPERFTSGQDLVIHSSEKMDPRSDHSLNSSSSGPFPAIKVHEPSPQKQSSSMIISSESISPTPPSEKHSLPPSPSETLKSPTSPTTIDLWGYPLTHTVTLGRPFRIISQNMHLQIEMEAGGSLTGKVQLTNVPTTDMTKTENTIDLRSITPGESKLLQRSESEENLVVNLRNGKKGGMTKLNFRWE